MSALAPPYGASQLLPRISTPERMAQLQREAAALPSVVLHSAAAANAVMLAAGYFTPLAGYMDRADALSVATAMHTSEALFWPVPILNRFLEKPAVAPGECLALHDPNLPGQPLLAVQRVSAVELLSADDISRMASGIFGTDDPSHPGVSTFLEQGNWLVSGSVEVLHHSYFESDFPQTFRTAMAIRSEMEQRGWGRVVAFQTRNPMHRAHEELCKMAQSAVSADGILIHMLLGKLKPGDIPAAVRDTAIRKMVELYFPPNTVLVSGYGFDMLYAGPREALLHAIFRQNCGCSHLVVGRDHAGVGDYYGAFDAQAIFEQVPPGALALEPFCADHTAWSKRLGRVVMMRDVPDHQPEDFVLLSGTKVREMLAGGEALPEEFARPEVAKILMEYYQ